MLVTCHQCQHTFDKKNKEIKRSKRHFCSRSCAATFNNSGKIKNKRVPRVCKSCGDIYFNGQGHRSVFCRTCFKTPEERKEEYKNLTLGQYHDMNSVRGKHPSWVNAHVRSFARSWNKKLCQLPCQYCGYSAHIELAHIKPISQFRRNAKLGTINHHKNLLVLCRNHHWEFDNEVITLSDIPSR